MAQQGYGGVAFCAWLAPVEKEEGGFTAKALHVAQCVCISALHLVVMW